MQRRKHPLKSMIFLVFVLFFIWVLLQFVAPLALPAGGVSDLSGVVGFSDNEYIIRDIPFPLDVVYSSGDRLCHQKPERSLFLNGNQMPYCSRCTALWIGLAFGLGFMVIYSIEIHEKLFIATLGAFLPLAVDGIGQLFGFWESSNILRILTGLPAGVLCGVVIGVIFDELRALCFYRHESSFEKPKP